MPFGPTASAARRMTTGKRKSGCHFWCQFILGFGAISCAGVTESCPKLYLEDIDRRFANQLEPYCTVAG